MAQNKISYWGYLKYKQQKAPRWFCFPKTKARQHTPYITKRNTCHFLRRNDVPLVLKNVEIK